jgi:hypothetical protein
MEIKIAQMTPRNEDHHSSNNPWEMEIKIAQMTPRNGDQNSSNDLKEWRSK